MVVACMLKIATMAVLTHDVDGYGGLRAHCLARQEGVSLLLQAYGRLLAG